MLVEKLTLKQWRICVFKWKLYLINVFLKTFLIVSRSGKVRKYLHIKILIGKITRKKRYILHSKIYISYGSHHKKHTVKIYQNDDLLSAKLTTNLQRKNSFSWIFSWPKMYLSRHKNHGSCWSNVRKKI